MSRVLDELWAESIKEEKNQPPKANWFEIYVKKEKEFQKAISLIDAKIDFVLCSTGDGYKLLSEIITHLDAKIDFLLFSGSSPTKGTEFCTSINKRDSGIFSNKPFSPK
jgi:hypothetical protein